jgi:hypothetical protein
MGNALRDSTALAVRGLPCLHRFVLVAIATITPDDKGTFYASLGEIARICGTQTTNVRKIVRKYEGRPNRVTGEGALLTGLDPGCFLYPTGEPAKQGQADRCHYTFAIPEVGPGRPRRKPKNPAGVTDWHRSVGRFPKPTTTPPQGSVSQTHPLSSAEGEGSVSQTHPLGLANPPPLGFPNRQIKEELRELRGGAGAPPLPPQESGRPGDTPGQHTPPSTPRPTLPDPILAAARRTLAEAQAQEAEEGEECRSRTA